MAITILTNANLIDCTGAEPRPGSWAPGLDAAEGDGVLAQQVEDDMTQDGAAFRAIALAGAVGVLIESDVQDPVEPVLDAPMGPDTLGDGLHVFGRQGADEVAGLGNHLPGPHGRGLHAHQRLHLGPVPELLLGQVGHCVQGRDPAGFLTPMVPFRGLGDEVGHGLGGSVQGLETTLDGLVEAGLVALHYQDVIGPLPDDLFGNVALPAHGVQGDDVARHLLSDIPDPGQETLPEGLGVEQQENPVDGVAAGNAVRQLQEGPQPVFLELGEPVDVLPTVRAAQGGQDGNQDDVEKVVALPTSAARVRQIGQMVSQGTDFGPHGCSLHDSQFLPFAMRYKCSSRTSSRRCNQRTSQLKHPESNCWYMRKPCPPFSQAIRSFVISYKSKELLATKEHPSLPRWRKQPTT
jgi:hypothetical protein